MTKKVHMVFRILGTTFTRVCTVIQGDFTISSQWLVGSVRFYFCLKLSRKLKSPLTNLKSLQVLILAPNFINSITLLISTPKISAYQKSSSRRLNLCKQPGQRSDQQYGHQGHHFMIQKMSTWAQFQVPNSIQVRHLKIPLEVLKGWTLGVVINFINILRAAFTPADPKSAKETVKLAVFIALQGSAPAKVTDRMLMKSTPGLNFINILRTAFTLADPECAKKDSQVIWRFWDLRA